MGSFDDSVNYDRILETYTLVEILELNDKTEEEALEFLVEREFISLPTVLPVDL